MNKSSIAAVSATFLCMGLAAPADAASYIKVGVLNCEVAGGSGFIFGSTKTLECRFLPADVSMRDEHYAGAISKFGVDLGFTNKGVLSWAVLSTSVDAYGPGRLAGHYVGASAEVTAVLGVGANVLVNTTLGDFTLQPISVGAQSGLNVALGIAGLDLIGATK